MSKAISVFILCFFTLEGYSSEKWQSRLDQLCEEDPQKRFALFPIHSETSHRLRSGEKKSYIRNVLGLVEVDYALQPENLENSNFKITKGYAEKAEKNECKNLKANNLYTHLNLIHGHYQQYQHQFPRIFEKLQETIVIRFDQEDKPDFFKRGIPTKNLYAANTTCGYLDYKQRRVVEKKEIWFQKSIKQASKWKQFLPVCFLGILDNSLMCDDQLGIESSLQAHIIYHEYAHLLTSHLFGACRESFFDEALANILAMHFTGEEWLNYKVDQSILPFGFLEHEFLKVEEAVNWEDSSREKLLFSIVPSYFLHLIFFVEKEFGLEIGIEFFFSSLLSLTKQNDLKLNEHSIFQKWLKQWPKQCTRLDDSSLHRECKRKLKKYLSDHQISFGKRQSFDPVI